MGIGAYIGVSDMSEWEIVKDVVLDGGMPLQEGMADCYAGDARKVYPKLRFLHHLPAVGLCDIEYLLGVLFGE